MPALHAQNGIPFYKLSPGGNTTLLVPASAVPAHKRSAVARELMDPLHLGAEQVGFIDLENGPPSLEMMGGEFCGNACRCLAALVVMLAGKSAENWPVLGSLRSSGADVPVTWRVRPCTGHALALDAAVCIDLAGAALTRPEAGVIRADLPGIVHILLDESLHPLPADPTSEAALWRKKLELEDQPGVGCIRHAPLSHPEQYITPLVWVRATNSSCPETACGSGSLALALALHAENGQGSVRIRQPSGENIAVELGEGPSGALSGWIGGPVRLIAQGRAFSHVLS